MTADYDVVTGLHLSTGGDEAACIDVATVLWLELEFNKVSPLDRPSCALRGLGNQNGLQI